MYIKYDFGLRSGQDTTADNRLTHFDVDNIISYRQSRAYQLSDCQDDNNNNNNNK